MYSAIKLSLNNEVRRLTIYESVLTYQTLLETTLRLFPSLKTCKSEISFGWIDDEEDLIILSSEEELNEAVRIMESQNKSAVRFEIILSENDSTHLKQEGLLEKAVHTKVTCDECGAHPILGVRYKCAIRKDYDLCSSCESKQVQPYPMVKIYSTQHTPTAIYIAVNDEDFPPSPPQAPHAEEWVHDIQNGSWHRPNLPHHGHPFGPPHGPPHHPPRGPPPHHPYGHSHGHPHGPPFGHGPHGHGKPWRGGRGGRGDRGRRAECWRKFMEEAVTSASDMATTVADLAQVHIADIAGALNKQTASANPTKGNNEEEDVMMNIAVAESLSTVDDSKFEAEEFKESSATESSHSSAAPEPVNPVELAESVTEWEVVPPNTAVPPVPSPPAAFAHGFIAPAVVRPTAQEAASIPAADVPRVETRNELDEWRAELQLLANMGFDNVLDVLPLLRKFCLPPVSQQPAGAEPYADGIQRVVHHLLSN